MKNLRQYISENRHFLILLLFIPLQIWFRYLEMTVIPKYITNTAIDNKIPFISVFVVPYLFLFPYLAFGIIYTGFHSRKDFYKLMAFLFGSMTICCAVYTLFPNGQSLRPVLTQNDPFTLLVRFIYATDTPTDVCPSMHIIDAIAITAALFHNKSFVKIPHGKQASVFVMVTMCFSTVLIKQHSLFDVVCGFATAVVFYIPLYLVPKFNINKDKEDDLILRHHKI